MAHWYDILHIDLVCTVCLPLVACKCSVSTSTCELTQLSRKTKAGFSLKLSDIEIFGIDGAGPAPSLYTKADVRRALKYFPSGSASALRASHLHEAVFCPSPGCAAHVLSSLTRMVNLMVAGHVPPVIPYLCGCLSPWGLQPIAVGELLRQLTSKCLSRAVNGDH